MSKICLRYILFLPTVAIFLILFIIKVNPIQARPPICPNCPTMTPTPTPTNTPAPTPTPTPTGECKHENAACELNNNDKTCCPGLICVEFNPNSGNYKCRAESTPTPTPTAVPSCGNGVCEASLDETCSGCPSDCGSCPSSTSTPTTVTDTSTQTPTPSEKPQITCNNFDKNPTASTNITFSGSATSRYSKIAKVEISINGGLDWNTAAFVEPNFNLGLGKLQDGNYSIKARAYDALGDVSECGSKTLVVDRLPPIIGGNIVALGPQIIYPMPDGTIPSVAGVKTSFVISMKGGITEAAITTDKKEFPLHQLAGTNLWEGDIETDKKGTTKLTAIAKDGANNTEKRTINSYAAQDYGVIYDSSTQKPLKDAKITLYVFDVVTKSWVIWDSASYGQDNFQVTSDQGQYSFLVPNGKYYLEVKKAGYQTTLSEITELKENAVLNSTIALTPYSRLGFSLGYFIPKIYPMQIAQTPTIPNQEIVNTGKEIPSFSFSQANGSKFTKDNLNGEKYVLVFFSPWSALSIEGISQISKSSQNFPNQVKVIGVSVQESPSATETFLTRGSYNFFAVADYDGKYSSDIGVTTLPYYVFVNSNSIIKGINVGVLSEGQLLEKINKME